MSNSHRDASAIAHERLREEPDQITREEEYLLGIDGTNCNLSARFQRYENAWLALMEVMPERYHSYMKSHARRCRETHESAGGRRRENLLGHYKEKVKYRGN